MPCADRATPATMPPMPTPATPSQADAHVAADYISARDSAANEEVTPVRSWTPESTRKPQHSPTARNPTASGFSAFAKGRPPSEDQPGAPSSEDPALPRSQASDGSTEDAAESFLGNWANPGQWRDRTDLAPADHQQAPSSAGDSPAATSDYAASVPASTFGEQTPAADDDVLPGRRVQRADSDHEARQPTAGADLQPFGPTRQHPAETS